ncbi:MAG: glycoside hydrolase family 19 protein [Candidatus Acidiferrales bacterium]
MNFPLPVEIISAILGPYVPLANVRANWPLVEAALDERQIYSPLSAVAAISTISVETGTFRPVKERGGPTYLANLYENRKDLGNVNPGDGARFCGRGFIQITGRWDYAHFGAEIGKDLVSNPDLALDPATAAAVFAAYFSERHIPFYAEQQNWEMVRRRVNGGLTGWTRFIDTATKLVAALNNPPPAAGTSQEATT